MATELVFRADPYAPACGATVVDVCNGGIRLDRTVFYAEGGGQPGDRGHLRLANGSDVVIATTIHGPGEDDILHIVGEGATLPVPGTTVSAEIDWERRHRLMRMHTCLHLLSAVVPFPVTGGSVGEDKGRLDFDIPEPKLDKTTITAELNRLIEAKLSVAETWITEEELADQPDLVKTMKVKPPMGAGRVRLMEVDGVDLQPCGGTHVTCTGEIGPVVVTKIKNKGKQNRRIEVAFAECA